MHTYMHRYKHTCYSYFMQSHSSDHWKSQELRYCDLIYWYYVLCIIAS